MHGAFLVHACTCTVSLGKREQVANGQANPFASQVELFFELLELGRLGQHPVLWRSSKRVSERGPGLLLFSPGSGAPEETSVAPGWLSSNTHFSVSFRG